MNIEPLDLVIRVHVTPLISLWTAIKLRVAGPEARSRLWDEIKTRLEAEPNA